MTQSSGRHVNIICLCERLVVSSGIRSLDSQKADWRWLVMVPGVKWPAVGVAPVAAAASAQLTGQNSWRM